MPNRLAQESSPYLLQHAENPVDWYPWGEEALRRARDEKKPIFLSIGYSACHWCHVMEHESFEDAGIAMALNETFVNVKVDREERPDLDQIYMNAVQLLTGRGGWPMSVFLTPDGKPFYAGTYFPPTARSGMPGFDQVIAAVGDAWRSRREQVLEQSDEITRHLARAADPTGDETELTRQPIVAAAATLERMFDFTNGGFGHAPKFPHPMDLRVLLRCWHREPRDGVLEMVTHTLDKMAEGGIYDQLGGGFHRYSVDARWLVPHFEKMLYDNALLTTCYVETYQATGNEEYARVARETLDYVLREMTDPAGSFYSTQDADSEGEEGKFYVWTPAEIRALLGEERSRTFCRVYDVTDEGNFEGHNILNLPKSLEQSAAILDRDPDELRRELDEDRAKLLAARNGRVWPGRDDKVLVSWNGLMIEAMAAAGAALEEPRYLNAAETAAQFVMREMRRDDGRLLHAWRHGRARFDAYLDDYACLANGLVSLYESTFHERWIDAAVGLADVLLAHFADANGGGFFFTADDHEALIARHKDVHDSSVPSGNAMAATLLVRLGKLCGRSDYLEAARRTLGRCVGFMHLAPTAAGQMLLALDLLLGPTPEIVLVGPRDEADVAAVLRDLRRRFCPNRVLAARPSVGEAKALRGLFDGKQPLEPPPTVYVCEGFTCAEPAVGREAALATWDRWATPGSANGPQDG